MFFLFLQFFLVLNNHFWQDLSLFYSSQEFQEEPIFEEDTEISNFVIDVMESVALTSVGHKDPVIPIFKEYRWQNINSIFG